jgi:hypothetical protein
MVYGALSLERIVDWFDGPMLALGRFSGSPVLGLISLLAFRPEAEERVVAFVGLGDSESKAAAAAADAAEQTGAQLREIVMRCRGTAELLFVRKQAIVARKQVAVAAIAPFVAPDTIDETLDDTRMHWFDAFKGSPDAE